MSLSDEQRIRFEYNWANHDAKSSLSREHRDLWHTFKYSSRVFARSGKRHVVWRLAENDVEVLDVFQLEDAALSVEGGVLLTFLSRLSGHVTASHTPSKLPGLDVFLWVPAISELRFAPHDWARPESSRDLRVALNFKQRQSFTTELEFGVQYMSGLNDFARLHPNAVI